MAVMVERHSEAEIERMRQAAKRPMPDLNETALTAAHLAVEDVLIEFRDAGISVIGPANGFVVKYADGTPNGILRIGTRDGLRIGIKAYLAALAATGDADG